MNKDRANKISGEIIRWCIYAVVFATPFSKSIAEIAITLSIVLWCAGKIANSDLRIRKTDLNGAFLIFVIMIIPSLFVSAYPALSIRAFFTKVLKFVVFYFVIVENINTKAKLKGLFITAVASFATILIDGLVQYYITGVDILHRYPAFKMRSGLESYFRGFPTASFPFPNDLAAWILLALFPLACAAIFGLKNSAVKYFTGALSMGLLYLFLLTKARGAWIGFAISTVYISLTKGKAWIILLVLIVIAIPFVLKMEMAQYIFEATSMTDRVSMWRTGYEIFKEHPVIGNGLNTFFVNFMNMRQDEWRGKKGSYAHNCYLQMACDTGLIGLAGFLWLIGAYFKSITRRLNNVRDSLHNAVLWGISIGVFAFLVHSFFDTNLYSLNLATLFWTAIGISQSIIRVSETA